MVVLNRGLVGSVFRFMESGEKAQRRSDCEARQHWAMDIIDAEGFAARGLGLPRDMNPYPAGSPGETAWHQGWDANTEAGHVREG